MPNIPQQETIVQYVANSSQLAYTFAFYAPLPTDIEVFYQASNATPVPSSDLLALNSQYTVTYNSDPITGGFITLLFTPTTGYYLTINRQVEASLNTSFGNAQAFNGNNLDAALDRLLLLCQQNQNYALQRNLSYVINTYLPDAVPFTQLPPLLQNQVWIGSASGVIAGTIADNPSASILQSMLANNSPGTDGSRIVGYYDSINSSATTVHDYLDTLGSFIADSQIPVFSGTDTGSADSVEIAITTPGFAIAAFQMFRVKVANTNTGVSTLTINAGVPITIKDCQGNDLTGNMMLAGQICLFVYDGVNAQLINPNKIFFGASMHMSAAQNVLLGTGATVNFDTATLDPVGLVSVSNKGFLINRAGYYRVNCNILVAIVANAGSTFINLVKNGVTVLRMDNITYSSTDANSIVLNGSAVISTAINDIITISVTNGSSTNTAVVGSATASLSNFDIEYLGS
jgi:hypothetical protein